MDSLSLVGQAMAVLCDADGFTFSVVAGPSTEPKVLEEETRTAPANLSTRGEKLAWLLREAADNIGRVKPVAVGLVRAGTSRNGGANPQRHEVEGIVQLAAHEHGVPSSLRLREQVRVIWRVPKGAGAFKTLLELPDAKARSNATRRELYVFAVAELMVNDD